MSSEMNDANIELLFGEEQDDLKLEEMLKFPEEVEIALEKVSFCNYRIQILRFSQCIGIIKRISRLYLLTEVTYINTFNSANLIKKHFNPGTYQPSSPVPNSPIGQSSIKICLLIVTVC